MTPTRPEAPAPSPYSDVDQKSTMDHVEAQVMGANLVDLTGYVYVPDTPEEKALVRKIDLHILPMLWVMYIMNYTGAMLGSGDRSGMMAFCGYIGVKLYCDRTNIGNAKVGGMEHDLRLTSSDYSLVLSIFFVGYLLWEVPSNLMLSRSKPSLFLPAIMFTWGAMSVGAKGVTSLAGMVIFRFFLGIVEAGFFPGVLLILSCWYKPKELSKRVAAFYTASLMSGAFGGLLAGGIIQGLEGKGHTRGWKWLFIIEGLITVVLACVAVFILPNYPATTSWLTPEQKKLATARLLSAAAVEEHGEHVSHWGAFKQALKDPKTYVFMIIYNVLNSLGTISYFFPTLMAALGYHGRMQQFMTVPIYAVALVISLTGGFIADKTGQKALVVAGGCLLAIVSFVIIAAVPNDKVKYAFLCFGGGGIWTAVPVTLSWIVTMFDGKEKRAVAIALINGFGNLSSVYGSFFWPSWSAPRFVLGFSLTCSLAVFVLIMVAFAKWRFGDKGVERTS